MYFFDTYALYQMVFGIDTYSMFKNHAEIYTSIMNLYELYYVLAKEGHEKIAELCFNKFLPCCLEIISEDVLASAKFRFKNNKKKFSHIDCLGYNIALRHCLFFVTGDDAFKGLENVKFIK